MVIYKSTQIALVTILLISIFLRFLGVNPGYPPYHPDEGMSYAQGIAMVLEKNIDAHGYSLPYNYPNLVPLINAFAFQFFFIPISWLVFLLNHFNQLNLFANQQNLDRIFHQVILGPREVNVLFWARYVTATFGVGTVLLTYLLAKQLFNKWIGLIASFLVAINYRLVLNSHLGLPDTYNTFFFLLTMIFSYRLLYKRTLANFFLAGLAAGLTFSTKFQAFPFIPIFLTESNLFLKQHRIDKKIIIFFLVVLALVVLLNPYHIINWDKTYEQVYNSSLKYQTGRKALDFYPISYLFNWGIGQILSILALLGVIVLFSLNKLKYFFNDPNLSNKFKTLYLLLPILAMLFLFAYYTQGGFYTRNLLTIIPLILIFASIPIFFVFILLSKIIEKKLTFIITLILLLGISLTSFNNSFITVMSYSNVWNFRDLPVWLNNNLPREAKVAAHSSVPLPDFAIRLPYQTDEAFSVEEFKEEGASYAIANLDWATNDFYFWMRQQTKESLEFWNKPVHILDYTYPALSLRELSDYVVYDKLKPWQAPDSNFIVAKLPMFRLEQKDLKRVFSFEDGLDGWQIQGQKSIKSKPDLEYERGKLISIGSSIDASARWESSPILVDNWSGFLVEVEIKTEMTDKIKRESYIAVSFYKNFQDAVLKKNRVGVRLTSRNNIANQWTIKEVMGIIPKEARFITLTFQSYGSVNAINFLRKVNLYQAKVNLKDEGFKKVKLDDNLIFPISHGNL